MGSAARAGDVGSFIYEGSYITEGDLVAGYDCFPDDSSCGMIANTRPRASVYIFATDDLPFPGAQPLVPLYRMSMDGPEWNGNPDNRSFFYTTEPGALENFHSLGYELDGVEGYIYPRCTPEPDCIPQGAVRLYRLYSFDRDDYAIFPESQLQQFLDAGYVSQPMLNDWIGYVYENVDSDVDHVIDGFEELIGIDPNDVDSDCDGLSDGEEIGEYPYSDPLGCNGRCGFTPWRDHANGDLLTDKPWNFAMGYHFTPLADGRVTQLGGFFNGTKTVKLFEYSTGDLLAEATVSAANDWSYTPIAPVTLHAGTRYTVAVYLAGSGGSMYWNITPLHRSTATSASMPRRQLIQAETRRPGRPTPEPTPC